MGKPTPHADRNGAQVPVPQLAKSRNDRSRAIVPGLLVCLAIAIVATVLGHLAPLVGAPVFAIVGGIGFASTWQLPWSLQAGQTFASRYVLQGSVVVLGFELSFRQVITIGTGSLPVLLGTLAVALIGARLFGRALSVDNDLCTMIGVGTGICGASAIAATDAVISASEADVSYAIATIFTFNVIAVLTFPTLGRLLSLSPHGFGLWAGTAINDLSSVVAASSIFGHDSTAYAVVVKLTRTLMIVPISIALALWRARVDRSNRHSSKSSLHSVRIRRALPVFIGWFLLAVVVDTLGIVPKSWHSSLSDIAEVMITMALAAIGLSTNIRDIGRAGFRPLALGAILWLLVAGTSLGLQHATGVLH